MNSKTSSLLVREVTGTVQNEIKEIKGGFLSYVIKYIRCKFVSLLGNILTGRGINKAGDGVVRAGYGNKKGRKNTKLDFNATSSFN